MDSQTLHIAFSLFGGLFFLIVVIKTVIFVFTLFGFKYD